jgi:hypothetical protein
VAVVTPKRLILAAVVVVAVLAGRSIDLARWAGDIKGDEATYIAMTLSLVHDRDLRYERIDYQRFLQYYPDGPDGIFLKRRYLFGFGEKTPVPSDQSLAFGKALVYPIVAAPFVALGGLGGLVVLNFLLIGLCVWCGATFCRAVAGPWAGWLMAVAFTFASIAPLYVAWATPELFNMTLVTVAYFLWLYKKVAPSTGTAWLKAEWTTLLAAILIGVAVFSKATHAAVALPLVLEAVASRRIVRAVTLSAACLLAVGSLFGLNALITGDANYQGAPDDFSRRSFNEAFPFDDRGTTFDRKGSAMVTNDADTGRVLAPEAIEQIPINVWYFFVGRHAGLIPYYLPGIVLLAWWIAGIRRASVWQWATATGIAAAIGGLIVYLPDSWNGGGGPPGNRYFLSLYPPMLFLIRPAGALVAGAISAIGGLIFVAPLIAHPYATSLTPWLAVERQPINSLPIELTLVNDLPCRLNGLRCPILFIREPAVQFYYMDGRTYSAEGDGTWIAGQNSTDIIVKTDLPPTRVRIEFSGPIANEVRGRFADKEFSISKPAGAKVAVTIADPTPFRYHLNSVYVLHLETTNGFVPAEIEPGSTDTRNLGVFIRPTFTYGAGN